MHSFTMRYQEYHHLIELLTQNGYDLNLYREFLIINSIIKKKPGS